MFTVCCVVCRCQLFCSVWMWCLEEVYRCCDMFSVVNVYIDHLKLCVLIVEGMSVVVNVVLSLMSVMNPLPCATYRCALL